MPDLMGVDIETTGLDITQARLVSIATYTANQQMFVVYPSVEALGGILNSRECFVGWNTVFDLAWLMKVTGGEPRGTWLDARLSFRFAYPDAERYSLGAAVDLLAQSDRGAFAEYRGFKQATETSIKDAAALWTTDPAAFRQRNELDAKLALLIHVHCMNMLNRTLRGLLMAYQGAVIPLAQAYVRGITMNLDFLRGLNTQLAQAEQDAMRVLGVDDRLVARKQSWLMSYFKDSLDRLPLTEKTQKPSFSAKHLGMLDNKHFSTLRKAMSMRDKFCKPYVDIPGSHKVVHNQPLIFGTYTGRVTYSKGAAGIPIQQWARPVRESLLAPEGKRWVEFDFAGQEMRIMASVAYGAWQDRYPRSTEPTTLCRLFLNGADLHTCMGEKLAGLFPGMSAKELRFLGKQLNLASQYRIGAGGLLLRFEQDGIQLTKQQAGQLLREYKNQYPEVTNYWEMAVSYPMAHTVYARWHRPTNDYQGDQTRINFPIQGTGADMKYICITHMSKHHPEFMFCLDMHDGMHYFVDETYPDPLLLEVAAELEHLFTVGGRFHCPMPVEVKAGSHWGNLKEIKKNV